MKTPAAATAILALIAGFQGAESRSLQAQAQPTSIGSRAPQPIALLARATLEKHCFHCHGQNGQAGRGVFVLNYPSMIARKVIVPGAANKLLEQIDSGDMPKDYAEGTNPDNKLTDSELKILRQWVAAGSPDFTSQARTERIFLTDQSLYAAILQDLNTHRPQEHQYLRYYSIAHLYNAGVDVVNDEELDGYRIGLAKLLNSLSWEREIAVPKAINPTRTLLRIDLRDLKWDARTWKLLVNAYPYAAVTPETAQIQRLSGSDVPFIRADWFVATASDAGRLFAGSSTPSSLYYQILDLPGTVADLEAKLGVDVNRNLRENRAVRAGIRHSGVSKNNRVVERHSSPYGAYWKSYDFSSNQGEQNIFADPLRFKAAGGEMIFNLPNGMQAYYIADANGRRLDVAPVAIVADRNRPDEPEVRTAVSCMSCHFAGMKTFTDDMRPTLAAASSASFDVTKALDLYPGQTTLNSALTKDSARFKSAVEAAGGRIGSTFNTEPISALTSRFKTILPLSQAAAEVGLTSAQFVERLKNSVRLQNLGMTQLLAPNGGIARDSWEEHFGSVITDFRLGQFIVPAKAPSPKPANVTSSPANAITPPANVPTPPANAPPVESELLNEHGTINFGDKTYTSVRAVRTDATGRFVVRAQPGTYRIDVFKRGAGFMRLWVIDVVVGATAGARVELTMKRGPERQLAAQSDSVRGPAYPGFIEGVVRDENGVGVGAAAVTLFTEK